MRQILVDEARRRFAQRRGGPGHFTLTLDETHLGAPCSLELILDLDDSLQALRASGDQGARMEAAVVYRWLGGCTVAEVADVLGISSSAVERDWRATQAWLKSRLGAV
jgi:DNA-directed RNA polymerase specialized sigma24 family protein